MNGQALAANAGPPTLLEGLLPPNFSAANVVFTVTTNLGGAISSEPYTVPSSIPPILALCALPTSASLLPGSSFLMGFQASSINVSGSPSLTSLTLPAGITTQATLPVALPSAGVRLLLQAGSSIAGTVSIPFTGGAAAASTNGTATFTVSTVAPSISLQSPLFDELAVPLGGQGSLTFGSQNYPYLDIAVNLAVSGLPAGATATVSPSTILPGDSFTVTVHAAANAPVSQNTKVIVTATPSSASAQPYTASFLLDITQSPGSLLNSRSDFVSTAATPLAAVYNRALDVIYASNPTWNRIDILSNRTRTLLQSISLRGPAGIDLSPDGGTLWIGTQSQQIFAMNTTTLALTRYLAPAVANFSSWQDVTLFALADGTLALSVTNEPGSGEISDILWNPNTNTTQTLSLQAQLEMRSGDHTKVYGNYINSVSCPIDMYDTVSGQTRILTGLTERCSLGAISPDGSRIVAENNGIYGLYDGSLNFLGALSMTLTNFSLAIDGGWLFSADGSTLYQVGTPSSGTPTYILTYNVGTRSLSGTAPALAASGAGPGGSSAPGALVDVDNSGILLAIQTFGISFQDSTFFQSYPNTPPGENVGLGLTSTLEGPLAGGTSSSIFGVSSELPDVWYGPNRGTASLDGSNDLTIVSPPGNAGGPVNLKFIYPNGDQLFLPEGFTYGPSLEYATLSGASPNGGVAGTAAGFGLPASPDGGTVTVGGRPAVITTEPGQYAPSTGEPFPSTFLNFTIPAGTPGYADLNVTTPTGTSTLPKAMFYAKSVNDYPSQDTFTDVLYDEARQQVYLAAGDHIDVFSMGSNQFVSPLRPASLGAASSFRGLALTTDGTELLAANMADGSLGVIHPDAPSQTFAIPIAAATGTGTTCARGPFAVTALAGNRAFVSAGLPPLVGGCPFNNTLSLVNLQTRSASAINTCGVFNNGYASALESTADGMHAILGTSGEGTCVYSTATNTFTSGPTAVFSYYGATISSDGNIAADGNAFLDLAGNALGNIGHPAVFYNTTGLFTTTTYPGDILQRPRLNGSGSLYYWAYPSYFEIIDVPTGTLRLRFSLAETVQNVETPLATDAAGQHVFLITSAGLTVVDLGTAPLSIGHFAPSNGARGTVIQVRGSGFEAGITATIGGQPATVTMIDQSTLSVAMPNTPSGPQSLTLTNPDGTTYTAPSAILAP